MSIIPAVTGVSVPERFAIPEPQKNVHVYLVYRVLMSTKIDQLTGILKGYDSKAFTSCNSLWRILRAKMENLAG